MTNTLQQRISNIRLGTASAALALAVVLLSAVITTQVAQAQTFSTLHSFDGTDGADPIGGLVQATNGNLYGTTDLGGAGSACEYGCGTVFKITPSGTLTTLHSFNVTDGENPWAGLVQATNGNLYGTTLLGGANSPYYYGTVFKITPSGTLTTLYSFCSQSGCTDGDQPYGTLVLAINGDLYGTTHFGGANNYGTVFKITPSGTLTTLHSFGGTDGAYPIGGLLQAINGDLYGTTAEGGANNNCAPYNGCGTIFKITPSGTLTTLYSFCPQSGCVDGDQPEGGMVQATNGTFYGTTALGGANTTCFGGMGCGTVFKITPSGTLTTLYSFCSQSGCTDGETPWAGLVQATDGNLYGATPYGGANGYGTVFRITPSGALTTLHNFDFTDGSDTYAGPVQDTNGSLYGTTSGGGANGDGTVFSLSVGLGPFVETQPTSGKVGTAVKILGTNLTGATSVTFNGTGAAFKVVSKSLITTTVPTGATTGTVEVTTPRGTLKSNVVFRVRK